MALVPTRFETAANWASSNPVLAKDEVGIETDTGFVKTGDGVRAWASLPKTDDQETSAFRAAKTSDETGTGAVVLATSPTLVTPTLTTPAISGGTATSLILVTPVFSDASITLEGTTADAYETTLTVGDPTADRTITFPNATGTVSLLTNTETLTNKTLTTPVVAWSVAEPAASATQTQNGGTAITAAINRVSTVATADDALTLPSATVGKVIKVKNAHATNQIGIFPALGENINALSIDAVYALPALKMVEFNCAVVGTWDTILTA